MIPLLIQSNLTRLRNIERRLTALQHGQRQADAVFVDPVFFARDKLGFQPDEWQQAVLQSQSKRILLNICRQAGKSTVSAILALHRALYVPRALILLVSPSLRQSSELFKKIQDFLLTLPVRPALTEDNKLSLQLRNGSRIVSLPSSEPTIRGFSKVNLLIEDESARVDDTLFFSTRPMLAISNGQQILMSTPFGRRGHFYETWENGGEHWERVKVTADECPRISPEFLAEERDALPDLWYRSEYNCEFCDTENSVFRFEDIQAALVNDVQPLWPVDDDFSAMLRRQQEGRAV